MKPRPLNPPRESWDGEFLRMDLSRDRFIHFTLEERALEIIDSGRLLYQTAYRPKGHPMAVYAVSEVWGEFVPQVQMTHLKAPKEKIWAVSFKTPTIPQRGHTEEVSWERDVVLRDADLLTYDEAVRRLKSTPHQIGSGDTVIYADWDEFQRMHREHLKRIGLESKMNLLNVQSGRQLREGDEVRVRTGSRRGKIGRVVGFDVGSSTPVVIQYPAPRRSGVIRENVKATDVDPYRLPKHEVLEPLPSVEKLLTEGAIGPYYVTCGAMLTFPLAEGGALTAVPKRPGNVPLRLIFDSRCRRPRDFGDASVVAGALRRVFEDAFITRLPHLVRLDESVRRVGITLQEGRSPGEVVRRLLAG